MGEKEISSRRWKKPKTKEETRAGGAEPTGLTGLGPLEKHGTFSAVDGVTLYVFGKIPTELQVHREGQV